MRERQQKNGLGVSRAVEGQAQVRFAAIERLQQRHGQRDFARPSDNASQLAVKQVVTRLHLATQRKQPIVLDLGCGTGQSTFAHAKRFPSALVVGIDKSLARLSKSDPHLRSQDNEDELLAPESGAWLVRANSIDIVAAIVDDALVIAELWLLYPNPWPKTQHLSRRWYGHPLFARLVKQCQAIECRTNWQIYAQEFAFALSALARPACAQALSPGDSPLSAFERKYQASGHALWQVKVG